MDTPGVVNRVGAVLGAVALQGDGGARLVDIASETQIPRPSVHRLLADLAAVGYIEQMPNKKYRLGQELINLVQPKLNEVESVASGEFLATSVRSSLPLS